MLDIFCQRSFAQDEVSRPLRMLKKQFAVAETAYKDAVIRIRDIRNEHEGGPIPAGSPMERRRKPTGLPPSVRKELEKAIADRDEARARTEALKTQIIEANSTAMREICAKARPGYVEHLRQFWVARLSRLKEEIVATESVNSIRLNLDAQDIRIMGLPPFTDEQRKAIERSGQLKTEVKELLQDGSLQSRDIPKELTKAWRL